jgi:hypothetical protein
MEFPLTVSQKFRLGKLFAKVWLPTSLITFLSALLDSPSAIHEGDDGALYFYASSHAISARCTFKTH